MKRIFLFDIDGTLVNTTGAGGHALNLALQQEFGVLEPKKISLSGRTDRGIAHEFFEYHQIESNDLNWNRYQSAYLKHLRDLMPKREGRVLPGVHALLTRLSTMPNSAMGLLTGNVFEGARTKLEHFELYRYFTFGGYGDRHPHRDDVAREALAAVHQLHGVVQDREVWVIGDTPLDIQCARAIGAKVLAVATGSFTSAELRAFAPDFVAETLEDATPLEAA